MIQGFIVLLILAAIHLFASRVKVIGALWHGRFLSLAAGISFAYVFVDLLPTLEKGHLVLKKTFYEIVPYLNLHTYLIALLGVLFYYGLHTAKKTKRDFWLSTSGYLLFNFFVGATLSDVTDPEIQPLTLFLIAMGMHYFISDHNASLEYPDLYQNQARWGLVFALFFGFFVGFITKVPDAIVAIVISFVSGGMILNAFNYELPKREQVGYFYFVFGALFYSFLLLAIGNR